MTGTDEDLDEFDCPRCGTSVQERFWGPCRACRSQLVDAYAAVTGDAAATDSGPARFEPAMHVVPNHVATKD